MNLITMDKGTTVLEMFSFLQCYIALNLLGFQEVWIGMGKHSGLGLCIFQLEPPDCHLVGCEWALVGVDRIHIICFNWREPGWEDGEIDLTLVGGCTKARVGSVGFKAVPNNKVRMIGSLHEVGS